MVVKLIDPMWGSPVKGDLDWEPEVPSTGPTEEDALVAKAQKATGFIKKYGGPSKPLKVPKTQLPVFSDFPVYDKKLTATYAVSELNQQLKNMGGLSSDQAMALEPSFSIEKSVHTQSYTITMELPQSVFHVALQSSLLEEAKKDGTLFPLADVVADDMTDKLHGKIVDYLMAAWS